MDLHGPGVESSEAPLFPSREAARASLAPLLAVAGLMLEALRLRARVTGVTRARELLIDSIAHDLRNPLNTFAMSAGLLRDDLEGEPIDAAHGVSLIARMERATARMQALIEDLTEASRVDARAVDYNLRDELPSKLIRDAVGAVRTERGPRITFDPGEDRAWVRADRARTLKVLAKLIDFTCKLTGEGGTIHLSCAGDGEVVRFTTRAVGPAGTPLPLPAEGRGGLALLIARGLVEGQGGALTVDDDDGVRLVFTLPVAPRSG
jgi:signal transduction histidine kinase